MLNETIQKSIKKDHDEIRKLLKDLEKALESHTDEKKQIFRNLASELIAHSKAEEKILYKAILEEADEKLQKKVQEGIQEHHIIDVLLKEMKMLSINDIQWEAKFEVLRESLEHHLEEEEKDILPESKEIIKDKEESAELSQEFKDEKAKQKQGTNDLPRGRLI